MGIWRVRVGRHCHRRSSWGIPRGFLQCLERQRCSRTLGQIRKTVNASAEIVIREVQGDGGFQMRQLLAESNREPRKAPKLHSHGQVLPFYKAGRNVPRIRIASPHLGYNLDDWAWGVPPSRI